MSEVKDTIHRSGYNYVNIIVIKPVSVANEVRMNIIDFVS